jgi:hypothetical protein
LKSPANRGVFRFPDFIVRQVAAVRVRLLCRFRIFARPIAPDGRLEMLIRGHQVVPDRHRRRIAQPGGRLQSRRIGTNKDRHGPPLEIRSKWPAHHLTSSFAGNSEQFSQNNHGQ